MDFNRFSQSYLLKLIFLIIAVTQPVWAGVRFFDFSAPKEVHRIADPLAYHLSSIFGYVPSGPFKNKVMWHITAGGSLPAITVDNKADNPVFITRMVMNIRARLDLTSDSFDLHTTDFTGGLNLIVPYGVLTKGSWEFFTQHTSSHMGDELLTQDKGNYPRQNYSREVLELSYARKNQYLEQIWSMAFIVHKVLESNEFFTLQYHVKVPIKERYFVASDYKLKNVKEWGIDVKLQAGVIVGKIQEEKPNLSFVLEYFNGLSPYGQFFNRREQYIGFGLISRVH